MKTRQHEKRNEQSGNTGHVLICGLQYAGKDSADKKKISVALNVSVEYLITGTNKKRKETAAAFIPFSSEEKSVLIDLSSIPQNIQKTFRTLIHQTAQAVHNGAD